MKKSLSVIVIAEVFKSTIIVYIKNKQIFRLL